MKHSYAAPLGIVLSGEEGIPYGKPALGCAVDLWITVSEGSKEEEGAHYIDEIVQEVEKETKKSFGGKVHVAVDYLEGLSSSLSLQAAEIVATTAFLYELFMKKPASAELISNLAFRVHKKIDPQASGLYTSLSTFGGLIYFRKEFEFLKGIYKLPYKIPPHIEKKLVVSFSQSERLEKLLKKDFKKGELELIEQEKKTKRMLVAIVKEDEKMFFNQYDTQEKKSVPYPFRQTFEGVKKL